MFAVDTQLLDAPSVKLADDALDPPNGVKEFQVGVPFNEVIVKLFVLESVYNAPELDSANNKTVLPSAVNGLVGTVKLEVYRA
jgi:hypothetical protein